MLTDGTGKAPEHVVSKAVLKNKDQDVREIFRPHATLTGVGPSRLVAFRADVVDWSSVYCFGRDVEREAQVSMYVWSNTTSHC